MVNDKYVVKYLDPRTGKYEYATIKDVGDLQKLNTKVKTSIVDAINSISTDGIGGLRNDLDTIGNTIKSLEDGTLELGDFQSIDDVVSREIEDAINSLKLENSGLLQLTQEEIDTIVSNAESEYRDSIAASVRELETSKTDLEAAREKMTTIGKMLENADIDYSSLTQVVDDINLYITDVIEKTDFDMVNGIVSDYKTAVTQTQDGWGVDASRNMLSYLTGRVKSNETSLDVQHGLIQAKVGKDEFQYMTVDNLPAGKENMLHNTSDLRDWNFSSAFIFKSADDYRFTSIVQSDSSGENITGTTDELEQGVTYAISAYVNVQNKNKEPGQEKYAPTDGVYTATVIIDGDTIELNNVVEDNSALDGWKRVSGTFIAKRTAKQDIKFYVTAFNRDTQVGYLSAPKLEKGSSATSWIPHIEDNVSTILSQNAVMRVLSDRITSSVEEVRETKGAFETATSTFDQMADGFELNTNKLSEVLDKYGEVTGVQTQQASELKVLNESITSKVWKQDINTTLDTINIDTSNRIVNSAFNIYSYDEQTGALKLDYWDNNTGFAIKKHSQSLDNYLYATRTGATSVNPISIKSSPFALRDGEKILFNFEYLAVGNPLDNDNVFTLEMYDNNDVRVGLQEFKLSELKKEFLTSYDVGDSYKYNGTYIVENSSVVKGTITLKLPKNGELWLTKIMLQNAGIGTIGWTPSSIDNQIIQSKLSTEINQLADSIELVATDERLDAINGLLVKKDGKIVISPEAIISRVTSQTLGDNALITQTSIKQTEDNLRFDLVDKDGVIQTINASAEGLLIDFDKVHIDGEVIARMISAQAIDVTQGFRLTDNNGNTLLALVNDNGKPTLSITKEFRVKIGEVNDKLDETIISVVDEYYHSTSQDKPVGGRWTSTPNDFRGDTFVWKRTKVVLQSGKEYYLPDENGINITSGWNYEKKEVIDAVDAAQAEADRASQSAKDANDLADKLVDDFDKLDISGVNLVLGSDTPKVLNDDGETKYFWNLENPLSDYALKSGDKLTVSMYAELFSESEKFKNWSDSYYQFMEHNTKTTGNLAINDLGLVGGAFVPDNPLWSYTPPTTGTSEAQLLTIRGVLQQYLATNEKKWLDTAQFLTDGLLNYYYPTPSIPSTPDSSWIPHWLVNVNAPFKSRRWATDGEVNFVNGVGKANIPAIFRVWSARTADSTLEYLWAPDSPVIGTDLEIESTDLKYKEDTGTIVLKDKTFTGKGLIVYTSWDGEIINVGDKCEAYPVWRPLEEGEIACAVDALPWALDVFQLWYEATGDEVWLQAVESTKVSIVSASNVSNTEYFIKPSADGEKVLKDGVTAFSTRSPKETYTNENGMIMIDYPASSGEASLGTWVGDNRALNSRSWIEVKVGSDKKEKIQIVIDEFADYDPDRRWTADVLLSGEGLTEDKHQYISLTNRDFYKADRVVWGSAYDKTTNVSAIASGNSSVTTKTNLTQLKNNHPVTQFDFKRGDEGGWLGWAQAMLGIWSYTFPFNMNYKTNDNLYFVVNDSEGVRWEYILPKTGDAFKTISIKADLFTSAAGGKLSTENYQSIVIEAIDDEALLYIDYIGFVDYFNGSNFSNVSLTYKQPTALKLALSYIKPAPSRNPLDYTPYIMPFDYHYINYQLSDMRGAIYSGYQVPWIYQENVFKEADKALATNLRFLSDAQDAYQSAIGVDGFFAPIYWWNYRTDYGQNEPNSWGITGNWGSVWGGFQYRAISDVARVFRKAPNNKQAYDIFMRFIKGMDANWTSTVDGFPTAFVEDKAPYTDQRDSHMVSNFMRALLYGWESSRLTTADKALIQKLLKKCYDYLDTLFNPIERFNNSVEGTWSPSPELDTWFNYWGGDILDGLAIARTSTAFNFGGETGQYSGELSLNTQNPNISLNAEPIELTNMVYGKKYRFNSTITLSGNDVAVRFDKPKLGITLSNTSKPFSLVVNKIKVEAGSKPTAHTLALSETVDVMAFSRFEKTLNGFRTTVRNMKSDKTTVTQLANLWRTTTELVDGHTSQITSMGTDINLRVSKGDLLSQINVEAGNVLIESGTNKLNITPDTTFIEDATIKSAMIESLDAGKIRTGTLDAGKVNVINLDAENITANKTSFVQSAWNDINSTISINGSGLIAKHSDGSETQLTSSGLMTKIPVANGTQTFRTRYLRTSINVAGLNHDGGNDGYLWVTIPEIYRGKNFKAFVTLSDVYGIVNDADYFETAIQRVVCFVQTDKIDYARGRVPLVGYAYHVNIYSGVRKKRDIQVVLDIDL